MFVLSPVGPSFDLETKKSCRVSDYALSDGGNRFSQFGLFHTVLKRHFSVRRSKLTLAARSWVQQNRPRFPPGVISSALAPYLAHGRQFIALRKILLTGKLFRLRVRVFLLFLSRKLFPFLTVRTRTNIFTQNAITRESALC